jgi:integrase
MKSGAPHEVPLSGMAIELLRSLRRFTGPYVFTSSAGRRPFQAFDDYKRKIDGRVPGLGDWRIHDLRRTMRTGLSTLGISPFVGELVIGHQQKGVAPIYDVHRYRDEKGVALTRWADHVNEITS